MTKIRYWAPTNGNKPGQWQIIEDSSNVVTRAKEQGAAFISTMAFEYEPKEDKSEPYRYGDLVFDLDNEDDPEIARQDCLTIVHHLEKYEVDPNDLRFFISGKKGFHIVVPDYILGAHDGDPMLPKIYGKIATFMATRLWPEDANTVDMTMYAMGKGKLIRVANIRREEGTYKVPISWQELQELNYSKLIQLASKPRTIALKSWNMHIPQRLYGLYNTFKMIEHNPKTSKIVDASKFIKNCKFIQHCLKNAKTLSEPEWHALLSVIKGLGKDGYWLAHDFSCNYPNYSHDETKNKLSRVEPNIRCEKIKELYDCGCDCGISSPSKLWTKASAVDSQGAAKHSDSVKLLELAEKFTLYPSDEGVPYADINIDDCRKTIHIETREFRQLVSFLFYQETGKPLKNNLASDLILDLTAKAIHGPYEPRKIYTRIAHLEDAIYIDLCDESWRAIEITAAGWDIVDSPPVRFRRVKSMQTLPEPVRGGKVSELRTLLNIDSEESILLEAWMIGTLTPGPYPILILEGEHGTAKSTTTRILRQIIDPCVGISRPSPRNEQDLIIAANNSHILALDNLSGVQPWLSDALCRVATGGSFSTRKLFTNDEESILTVIKPIVLNGIDKIAERHDLADRSLRVTLPFIPPEKRMTENQLNAAFRRAAPKILGGLCDGLACALKNLKNVEIKNPPRMADFTHWAVAAEDAMPWKKGEFFEKYSRNQSESIQSALESDEIANAIKILMNQTSFWEGKPTDLLNALDTIVDEKVTQLKSWPKTPVALGKRLTRTQAFLRKSGVDIIREKGGNRTITIQKTYEESEPTSIGATEEAKSQTISIDQFFNE